MGMGGSPYVGMGVGVASAWGVSPHRGTSWAARGGRVHEIGSAVRLGPSHTTPAVHGNDSDGLDFAARLPHPERRYGVSIFGYPSDANDNVSIRERH